MNNENDGGKSDNSFVPMVANIAEEHGCKIVDIDLVVNTNLGGDNAGRGAVLGALLGAANGMAAIPSRWKSGLRQPPPPLRVRPKNS